MLIFEMQRQVCMSMTDASGAIYFPKYFEMATDAFEAYLRAQFETLPCGFPIVKTEGEFLQPVKLWDSLEIRLTKEKTGRSSFTLKAQFARSGDLVAVTTTTHVAVDPSTFKPIQPPF